MTTEITAAQALAALQAHAKDLDAGAREMLANLLKQEQPANDTQGDTQGDIEALLKDDSPVVPAIREYIRKLEGQRDTARAELEKTQAERREEAQRVGLKKAEDFVDGLKYLGLGGAKREQIVKAVYQLRETDEVAASVLEQTLTANNEKLRKSHLFQELGVAGRIVNHASPSAEADAKAAELRKSEAGKSLTKEQALARVYEEDPDLFKRVEAEGIS